MAKINKFQLKGKEQCDICDGLDSRLEPIVAANLHCANSWRTVSPITVKFSVQCFKNDVNFDPFIVSIMYDYL